MNNYILLIYCVLLSATLHIYFDYKKKYFLTYFFKPLTILLVITIAFLKVPQINEEYRFLIILGLVFSLIGDTFLMIKSKDYFTFGLIFFLLAHLSYISAIGSITDIDVQLLPTTSTLFILYLFVKYIFINVKKNRSYVVLYAIVLLTLFWLAGIKVNSEFSMNSFYIFMGVFLFTISDFILAYNKFTSKFWSAQIIILSTYYIAQLLLAYSI